MSRRDSPWYLSARAVGEYAALIGMQSDNDDHFNRCEDDLVAIARAATFCQITSGGLLEYHGSVPVNRRDLLRGREHRLVLLVSNEKRPEGNLPQLVSLKLRGSR